MKSNRAPSTAWFLRAPVSEYPNAYVVTEPDDEIRVTYFEHKGNPATFFLSRKDARLLAKRINQCLDATVRR
jgi:hypothetical protein